MQTLTSVLLLAASGITYAVYLMRAEFNKDRHATAWNLARLSSRNKENIAFFDMLRSEPGWNASTGRHSITSLVAWKEVVNS